MNTKRKILIISASTTEDWRKQQYDITNLNKREYAELHGYDYKFIEYERVSSGDSYYMKPKLMLDRFNKYDWVMWTDADVWIGNKDISLDDMIDTYANDRHMLIAQDCRMQSDDRYADTCLWLRTLVNTGVILIRCSDEGRTILKRWMEIRDNLTPAGDVFMRNNRLNDQKYMCLLLMLDRQVYNWTFLMTDMSFNRFVSAKEILNCQQTFIWHAVGRPKIGKYKQSKDYPNYLKMFKTLYDIQQATQARNIHMDERNTLTELDVDDVLRCCYVTSDDGKFHETTWSREGGRILPTVLHTSSHADVIRHAKECGLPFVMICDKDSYPCANMYEMLKHAFTSVPSDTDILLLGWTDMVENGVVDYRFDKVFNRIISKYEGATAYVVFNNAYDRYLDLLSSHSDPETAIAQIGMAYAIYYPVFIQVEQEDDKVTYVFRGKYNYPPYGFSYLKH